MSKLQLLITEDSELLCSRLAQILSEIEGVEIMGIALNAADAYRHIEKSCPDIAILDICLPDGNGIEILKEIRKNGYPTKIIIFTQYPFPQYKKRCLQNGADYFFDKSTEFEKLFQVIRRFARKQNNKSSRPGP